MKIYRQKVIRRMDALGYAESTFGTRLIREAVQLVAENSRAMFCKDVYPTLAKKFGMTPSAVERSMRAATEKARRSPSWEFAWRVLGGVNTPTNGEIVWRLVRECAEAEEEEELSFE